jgi:hypothetical protein
MPSRRDSFVTTSRGDKEKQRLASHYAAMPDLQLLGLARQSADLTEAARNILQSEIARRALSAEATYAIGIAESDPLPELALARAFRDLPDALVAKSVLDSAGVECFLFDENYIRLNWFHSTALHGVKLEVAEEDILESRELLDQDAPESFEISETETYTQPRCPVCRSQDVSFQELVKRVAFAAFFINIPVALTRDGWICHTCRHPWKNQAEYLYDGDWLNWRLVHSLWFVNFVAGVFVIGGFFEPVFFLFWLPPTLFSAWLFAKYVPERKFSHALVTGFLTGTSYFLFPLVVGLLLGAGLITISLFLSALLMAFAIGVFDAAAFVFSTWVVSFLVDK